MKLKLVLFLLLALLVGCEEPSWKQAERRRHAEQQVVCTAKADELSPDIQKISQQITETDNPYVRTGLMHALRDLQNLQRQYLRAAADHKRRAGV